LFLGLVVFVRLNYKGTNNNQKENDNINNEKIEENTNQNNPIIDDNTDEESEIDSMFSFIDLNNYNFKYTITYNNVESIMEGKRYNKKLDFSLSSNNEIIYFNGTSNYIKVKTDEDGDYRLATLPFALINFFDNNIIKDLILNSELNEGIYIIPNSKISIIINDELDNKDGLNEIELVKRNNKVVKIIMNLTNAFSAYSKENVSAKIILEYFDFGLVEDFSLF